LKTTALHHLQVF